VLTVETTALRDRREDTPAMIALFLREATHAVDGPLQRVSRIEQDPHTLHKLYKSQAHSGKIPAKSVAPAVLPVLNICGLRKGQEKDS
jgi:hypothetical protein